MATTLPPNVELLTTEDLARRCRELRTLLRFTQPEVAERLKEAGHYDRLITSQAISQAERMEDNTALNGLRVLIIEVLSGKRIEGPVWYEANETKP